MSRNTHEIAHISQNRKAIAKVFPFPRVSPIKWEKVKTLLKVTSEHPMTSDSMSDITFQSTGQRCSV
jgi:hypothetical protein